MAEEQFGELLAAMRKAQADVMLFLEEKEQVALNQANGIKTHLEHRSAQMEKSRQELERIAAISNTVLFLEVGGGGVGWGGGRHGGTEAEASGSLVPGSTLTGEACGGGGDRGSGTAPLYGGAQEARDTEGRGY